ncbi:MAG: hypothetical protein ACI9KE_002212 [Polyangiales bacterium]|jgi:uncharacterized protein YbjT (DUF2867 family)
MTRPVLVLGAYGGAGRAVVDALRAHGSFEVVAAGRNSERLARLASKGIQVVELDVTDLARGRSLLRALVRGRRAGSPRTNRGPVGPMSCPCVPFTGSV